jgi:hypothetical protein
MRIVFKVCCKPGEEPEGKWPKGPAKIDAKHPDSGKLIQCCILYNHHSYYDTILIRIMWYGI